MAKKLLSIFFGFLCLSQSSLMAASLEQLPEKFFVKERWISWTTSFDIQTDSEKLGSIHRKWISLTPEYHLKNPQGEFLAKGKMRFFSFNSVFDVEDENGQMLGQVVEKFFSLYPTFYLTDPSGKKLAKAELNFWGTQYTLSDPNDGHFIATISRHFFRWKNDWTVSVLDANAISENGIHPSLFLIIMAYQVDREYLMAQRAAEEEKHKKQRDDTYSYQVNEKKDQLLRSLATKLDAYKESFSKVELQEEDFSNAALFAENEEENRRVDTSLSQEEEQDPNMQVLQKMEGFVDMLSSEKLSREEKAALHMMLEDRLEKISYR
jgi:uncharacterized protein YxjI